MTERPDPQNHYYLQLDRRFRFLEEWRTSRRELATAKDLVLGHSQTRNARVGVLVGDSAGVPTKMIDARVMELDAGQATSTHRHAHDAVIFVLQGRGTTIIDGERVEWEPWDVLHTPAWSWHAHMAAEPARLLAVTDAPLLRALHLERVEDAGAAERGLELLPAGGQETDGSLYEEELRASERAEVARAEARRITRWREVTLRLSPKGTRTALLVDRSLGFDTSGISLALFEIPPGKAQSKHRHPGEAILYIVRGRGYSVIEDRRYEWGTGDAVLVNQYVWHQHFNADPELPATVIRLHMWESIIEIMQAVMDPVPLYEDDPALGGRDRAWDQATPEAARRRHPR
ncbi:MAG: cupin domain-containing protein [bacterium]|jgi:gentisate 1,2-dioxygenase|nr:cupin domain-containing protein [bacterium]